MALALSGWWIFGWVVGAVVVLIAAVLLLAIIGLGRRVVRQADAITAALDGTRQNTDPLWALKDMNVNLSRVVRGLTLAREAVTSKAERSPQ
jgi:hypothetical protein